MHSGGPRPGHQHSIITQLGPVSVPSILIAVKQGHVVDALGHIGMIWPGPLLPKSRAHVDTAGSHLGQGFSDRELLLG
jgi:hypothetical protein